jgi:septum formation protein
MPEVILASGSRFRRELLERAGVRFRVRVADVDEGRLRAALLADDPDLDGSAVALALAEAKALAVSALEPDALVIGADQVLVCGGEVFSKPLSIDAARQQLCALRGLTHALPTAVVVARRTEILWSHVEEPELTMREFSEAFLDAYLAAVGDAVRETVGGYKLEGLGAQLFDTIEGDYFSIIGLPLMPVLQALRGFGVLQS